MRQGEEEAGGGGGARAGAAGRGGQGQAEPAREGPDGEGCQDRGGEGQAWRFVLRAVFWKLSVSKRMLGPQAAQAQKLAVEQAAREKKVEMEKQLHQQQLGKSTAGSLFRVKMAVRKRAKAKRIALIAERKSFASDS